MRVEVFANPDTFHVLKADGCPSEFVASNGWRIIHRRDSWRGVIMERDFHVLLAGTVTKVNVSEAVLPALTAIHEMVYQLKPVFSDDGQTVTLEHGTFRIEEWAGGQTVFQVLEMDEEFIGKTHNRVQSEDLPALYERTICLWGRKTEYNLTASASSKFARTQIIEALRDWDRNWPGWTRKTPTLEQCCKFGSIENGGMFVFDSEVGK